MTCALPGAGKIQLDEWSTRFDVDAVAQRWDSTAVRKLRDALYLQKISPAAFMRQCDANRDGRVSAAELQRTFVGVVDGLSNAEAAELVRASFTPLPLLPFCTGLTPLWPTAHLRARFRLRLL